MNEIDKINEIDEVDDINKVKKDENIVDVRDYMGLDLHQLLNLQQNLMQSSFNTKIARSKIENLLENLLDKVYQNDKVLNSIIAAKQASLWKLPANLITKQSIKLAIRDLTLKNSGRGRSVKLYVKSKMYVPGEEKLKLFLLQQHHNSSI